MAKKILLGTLLVGLIGILVAGGVIRTLDKTGNVAEAQGRGYGSGRVEAGESTGQTEARGQGYGRVRNADAGALATKSRGYGQGAGNAERQYPNFEAPAGEQFASEGSVVQIPSDGVDLVIATDEGQEIKVGTGPGYMAAQGFSLEAGERVRVQGFFEDEELKATQITRLADGESITLRDDSGPPAWAGSGQRATERLATGETVQGQGGSGQAGGGWGGNGDLGQTEAPSDGLGVGQAEVEAWLETQGTITSIASDALIVQTADGQEITLEGRAWRFIQEQGFQVEAGDTLTLTGFYEGEELEVGKIENGTSGQTILVRDENGRPKWAGGGRRGG